MINEKNILDYTNLARPSKQVWVLWIALIIVMIGLYVFFNGH